MLDDFDFENSEINEEDEEGTEGDADQAAENLSAAAAEAAAEAAAVGGAAAAAAAAAAEGAAEAGSGTAHAAESASSAIQAAAERIANGSAESRPNAQDIPNIIKEGDKFKELPNRFETKKHVESVIKDLPTGDMLIRDGDTQHLVMPNGARLSVRDGNFSIKGNPGEMKVTQGKDGVTTISFADGGVVQFDKQGILNVSRGNESVSFPRKDIFRDMRPIPHEDLPGRLQDLLRQNGASESQQREREFGGAVPNPGSSSVRPSETQENKRRR